MPARSWDGRSYDRVSAPMEALGRDVVARLPLNGDETVLDAGCGSGRVTQALIEALPRGRVIAVDASESMVAAARERLRGRADVRRVDLLELELEQPLDAVLSTATFHWIADHDLLFRRLRSALKGSGRLAAQCGGEGNVANVHAAAADTARQPPYAESFARWRGPWNFSSAARAEQALRDAGFSEARCWLMPVTITPEDPLDYLRTIVLGAHLERLAPELHERYVAAVAERLGDPVTIEYVRLNIDAVA